MTGVGSQDGYGRSGVRTGGVDLGRGKVLYGVHDPVGLTERFELTRRKPDVVGQRTSSRRTLLEHTQRDPDFLLVPRNDLPHTGTPSPTGALIYVGDWASCVNPNSSLLPIPAPQSLKVDKRTWSGRL